MPELATLVTLDRVAWFAGGIAVGCLGTAIAVGLASMRRDDDEPAEEPETGLDWPDVEPDGR